MLDGPRNLGHVRIELTSDSLTIFAELLVQSVDFRAPPRSEVFGKGKLNCTEDISDECRCTGFI